MALCATSTLPIGCLIGPVGQVGRVGQVGLMRALHRLRLRLWVSNYPLSER